MSPPNPPPARAPLPPADNDEPAAAAAAQGLGQLEHAADAWRRALAALPAGGGLTPPEQRQRTQYAAALAAAEATLEARRGGAPAEPEEPPRPSEMPWHRATEMSAFFEEKGVWSSSVSLSCHPREWHRR